MHEFSMCEAMLETLTVEYDRFLAEKKPVRPPQVTVVRLALGAMHQIVSESFLMAYEALIPGTPFAGSALSVRTIPLTVRCRACAWEGAIRAPFFLCARCGGREVETVTGMEFYIEELELEDDEPESV